MLVTDLKNQVPMLLELQRDLKVTNKLFLVLHDEEGLGPKREMYITLK